VKAGDYGRRATQACRRSIEVRAAEDFGHCRRLPRPLSPRWVFRAAPAPGVN